MLGSPRAQMSWFRFQGSDFRASNCETLQESPLASPFFAEVWLALGTCRPQLLLEFKFQSSECGGAEPFSKLPLLPISLSSRPVQEWLVLGAHRPRLLGEFQGLEFQFFRAQVSEFRFQNSEFSRFQVSEFWFQNYVSLTHVSDFRFATVPERYVPHCLAWRMFDRGFRDLQMLHVIRCRVFCKSITFLHSGTSGIFFGFSGSC